MAKKNKPLDVFRKVNMHGGNPAPCWEYEGTIDKERPYFWLDGRKWLAYRLVFNLYNKEEIKKDEVVRHTCDNGAAPICCCNPHHLVRGTHTENMNDMKTRERHGLTHHAVRAIRQVLSGGEQTHKQIAKNFGVSRETITAINNDRVYSHVEDEEDGDKKEES